MVKRKRRFLHFRIIVQKFHNINFKNHHRLAYSKLIDHVYEFIVGFKRFEYFALLVGQPQDATYFTKHSYFIHMQIIKLFITQKSIQIYNWERYRNPHLFSTGWKLFVCIQWEIYGNYDLISGNFMVAISSTKSDVGHTAHQTVIGYNRYSLGQIKLIQVEKI